MPIPVYSAELRSKTRRVFTILLNWNNSHHTLPCLASLSKLDYPAHQVIVVDNGSSDDSPKRIRAEFPGIEVIELGRNLGFCEGNNVGFRRALELGADYVLELNNDTEVAPDFLTRLVEVGENDALIGVLGPKIYYYGQPEIIWSAGGEVDSLGVGIQLGLDQKDQPALNVQRDVDYVSGCALLIKRQAIEQAGMNDPDFFIYYDEVEWCFRVRNADYRVVYVPGSVIWHKIVQETRSASATHTYLMRRNRLLFLHKSGATRWTILRVMQQYLRTCLAWTLLYQEEEKRKNRKAILQAIGDYLQGRFGPPPFAGK